MAGCLRRAGRRSIAFGIVGSGSADGCAKALEELQLTRQSPLTSLPLEISQPQALVLKAQVLALLCWTKRRPFSELHPFCLCLFAS